MADSHPKNSGGLLEELESELEILRRVHIRSIFKSAKSGEIDETQLKQVASYIKVLQELVRLELHREDRSKEDSRSARLIWEVLSDVPELKPLLSDPQTKRRILMVLRRRMREAKWER